MLADDLPHLEEIDVHPPHERRGQGPALVRAVCEWAADSGYAMLPLTTFRAVLWNYPFYTRLGFVVLARLGAQNWSPSFSTKRLEGSNLIRELSWGIDAGASAPRAY